MNFGFRSSGFGVTAREDSRPTAFSFRVTRHSSPVTPFDWRLAGLAFFGTPGSIDQISRSDQAVKNAKG
jgi:hypothetical protein